MAQNSGIQWTTHTFNPWRGCTKVSEGCRNCYADTMSKRNPLTLGVWGPNGTRVVAAESQWKLPVKWDREAANCELMNAKFFPGMKHERPRVFCASLADVFEDWHGTMVDAKGRTLYREEPNDWHTEGPPSSRLTMQDVRLRLFTLIDATPNLDWLLLTKRPENIAKMLPLAEWGKGHGKFPDVPARHNVWLGASVENQAAADARIPHLLRVPAAVRFLSCEPLLGPVILHKYIAQCECGHGHGFTACPNTGGVAQTCHQCDCRKLRPKLHWVIVGGESGGHARPFNLDWARSIVRQCQTSGVAVFVKQLGSHPVCRNDDTAEWFEKCGHLNMRGSPRFQGEAERVYGFHDRHAGIAWEWPADLQVREFPEVKVGAA